MLLTFFVSTVQYGCNYRYYHCHLFFLRETVLSQGCSWTQAQWEKMMKLNVTVVRGVQGHSASGNFEKVSSQKCHFLHSESLSCFIYGIFMSQFLSVIS